MACVTATPLVLGVLTVAWGAQLFAFRRWWYRVALSWWDATLGGTRPDALLRITWCYVGPALFVAGGGVFVGVGLSCR